MIKSMITRAVAASFFALAIMLVSASTRAADAKAGVDNGTDPTRLSNTFMAKYEHLDLARGISSDTLRLKFLTPIGETAHANIGVQIPVTAVGGLGDKTYRLGDISFTSSRVFGVDREGGYVLQGEVFLDTADRAELGSGKNVFKGTFIRAWFLSNGDIFAPALVQENSFSGQSNRADVNQTTIDFYYVPKMADPRNLITFDPALVMSHEAKQQYGTLAITFGRVVGKALGGNAVAFIKPTVMFGGERPGSWGIEVGYKLIGF